MFLFIMTETPEDPYLMDEEDPAQSCALESSLWEIKVCMWCFRIHTLIIPDTHCNLLVTGHSFSK